MWELVDLDNREAIALAKFVSSYIAEQVKKAITFNPNSLWRLLKPDAKIARNTFSFAEYVDALRNSTRTILKEIKTVNTFVARLVEGLFQPTPTISAKLQDNQITFNPN